MDTPLACRLSHASNLAYAISETGQNFEPYPELDDDLRIVGFKRDGCKFFRPAAMDNINACYYGVTTSR